MDRKELLLQAFDRSAVLQLDTQFYRNFLEDFLALMLRSDLGSEGDLTSRTLIHGNPDGTATIVAKEAGVLAGIQEVLFLYQRNGLKANALLQDGAKVKTGQRVLEVSGSQKAILMLERTAVNIIQHMSGIATLTATLAKHSQLPIAATRKTLWGLLDKRAVAVGGGLTHRLNAADAILIKSNHIDAQQSIPITMKTAWKKRNDSAFIEIEVRDLREAVDAARACADLHLDDPNYPLLVMFDNFSPTAIRKTLAELKKQGLYQTALFEASGGITTENIEQFSACGVDVLSLGILTHSAPALNFAQRLQ